MRSEWPAGWTNEEGTVPERQHAQHRLASQARDGGARAPKLCTHPAAQLPVHPHAGPFLSLHHPAICEGGERLRQGEVTQESPTLTPFILSKERKRLAIPGSVGST